MSLKVDDPVWYWARRKGEAPHKKYAIVLQVSEVYARVRVYAPIIAIQVQTVAVTRLKHHGEVVKQYLGDGVYAQFDGFAVVLTTEDGVRVTNTVVLEPEVYSALVEFVERLEKR